MNDVQEVLILHLVRPRMSSIQERSKHSHYMYAPPNYFTLLPVLFSFLMLPIALTTSTSFLLIHR